MSTTATATPVAASGLEKETYHEFALESVTRVTHNVKLFRFHLPEGSCLGLPPGRHLQLKFTDAEGKDVRRPYTPISPNSAMGYFELLIKIYPQGKMTQHLDTLAAGDTMLVRGPTGLMEWSENMYSHITLIAGGTGITPCIQVIRAVLDNPRDVTELVLIFSNTSEDDILALDTLKELAHDKQPQLRIVWVVSRPKDPDSLPSAWVNTRISEQLLRDKLPPPGTERMRICLCGPAEMIKGMVSLLEEKIGYPSDSIFRF
jgi:cytochrome-b5 reductase